MGKNKTIRGTRPTLLQRKILVKSGNNPEEFMFVKEIIKHEDGEYKSRNRKSLNKTSEKKIYWQFVNRETGNIIEIERS